MGSAIISPNDAKGIADYCAANYPEPRKKGVWRAKPVPDGAAPDSVTASLSFGLPGTDLGLDSNFFERFYLRWTREVRFQHAAWRWIAPVDGAPLGLKDLNRTQLVSGLRHYPPGQPFVVELQKWVQEAKRNHAPLSDWIDSRLALLDVVAGGPMPATSNELLAVATAVGIEINRAAFCLGRKGTLEEVSSLATPMLENALHACGRAVLELVCVEGHCPPGKVTMMLPCPNNDTVPLTTPLASANAARASSIWSMCSGAQDRLVVVAETGGLRHQGFWLPVFDNASRRQVPGAGVAFQSQAGDTVYLHDIPEIDDVRVSPATVGAWKAYLKDSVDELLFVSLPLVLPGSLRPHTAAIINVHLSPPHLREHRCWHRLRHDEWLHAATQRIAPFAQLAFTAFAVLCGARNENAVLPAAYRLTAPATPEAQKDPALQITAPPVVSSET